MEVWIGRDGERHGPYKEADVRQWLRTGQLGPDDLGWYDGLADWQPLSILFADETSKAAESGQIPPTIAPPPVASPPAAAPTILSTPAAQPAGGLADYAGFWQRFAAWLIDYLILSVLGAIIAVPLHAYDVVQQIIAAMQSQDSAAITAATAALRPFSMILVVLGFVYYVAFESSRWQATPGKLALRLRVCGLEGEKLGLARIAGRNVVRLLNALTGLIPAVCYIAIAWTKRKQGLHDLAAKTLVLNGRAKETASAEAAPKQSDGDSFSA